MSGLIRFLLIFLLCSCRSFFEDAPEDILIPADLMGSEAYFVRQNLSDTYLSSLSDVAHGSGFNQPATTSSNQNLISVQNHGTGLPFTVVDVQL